ncbi:caspase domain-containing protein [Mycena latifolia]|nr:caspase domain-containing protein [Mycena latifolia]
MTAPSSNGKVFALVIGIDDYKSTEDFPTLRGAVNDALAFKQYLLDPREKRGLGVPESNIVVLENRAATRERIMGTFKSHFLENPVIPDHGDATMILFYAGHGARMEAPGNWGTADGQVETICPVDERTIDKEENYIHTIPDYILGWLLRDLSAKKGPNITVILDSCHAGGMGRDVGQSRSALSPSQGVPLDLDSDLWKNKTTTVQAHRMWAPSAASHVLLAACREDETAREISYPNMAVHGRFTHYLISQLRSVKLETTTYAELVNLLPKWSGQTPHCGGERRNRLVFDGNYPATGRRTFPLAVNASDPYRVEMGSVEGVIPGTVFTVHALDNTILGTLVACVVYINYSTLAPEHEHPLVISLPARVVVKDWKNPALILHVYTPPDFPDNLKANLFPAHASNTSYAHKYVEAPECGGADTDIALRADGDQIVVEHLTSTLFEVARETRFAHRGNTAHLPTIVDGIAHFSYFLERHGPIPVAGVALEMHRLAGKSPGRYPDRQYGRDGNLVEKDEVRCALEPGTKYGFTIRNHGTEDLFPYLFSFDPEDYTINNWYSPAGIHMLAPLKRNGGAVTIGMGGEAAFEFALPPGKRTSSVFLKLFVTTTFVDLGWIKQLSPFAPEYEGTDRLTMMAEQLSKIPKWDAFRVVLTMTN